MIENRSKNNPVHSKAFSTALTRWSSTSLDGHRHKLEGSSMSIELKKKDLVKLIARFSWENWDP